MRTRPVVLVGAVAGHRRGWLVTLDGGSGALWNGEATGAQDVAALSPDLPLSAAFHGGWVGASISADAAACEDLVSGSRTGAGWRWPVRIHRPARQAHRRMAALAARTEEGLATPGLFGGEEAQRSLRASLLDGLRDLFEAAEPRESPRRGRASAGRYRTVRRADDYLRANPARPIYTGDLCAALGVSASALHEAFRANLGVSVHRYLKLRRMGMVRAALLTRSGPWRSVKAAALSHGFWHLGQFAHDYRAVYGEAPSETMLRAR